MRTSCTFQVSLFKLTTLAMKSTKVTYHEFFLIYLFYACVCVSAYTPDDLVRRVHNLPHLDSKLRNVDNEFDITTKSRNREYETSLVVFPTILGVLGILAVLGFLFGMCLRCCGCCLCGPKEIPSRSDVTTKRNLLFGCVLFAAVIVAFDFSILSGNASVTKGVEAGNRHSHPVYVM